MLQGNNKPIANSLVVLREEFDDWAILFDPDTGEGYGLNPMSVFIWKRLDGKHSVQDIVADLHENNCKDMPDDAADRIQSYIDELIEHGLAGYELREAGSSP